MSRVCDGLPYILGPCHCCGYIPKFSRNFQWIDKKYFIAHTARGEHCSCPTNCAICYPNSNDLDYYGLMWVGSRYYTPESFIIEAERMGVSKAIPKVPKDIIFGETWILLVHGKVTDEDYLDDIIRWDSTEQYPGVFYAFVPQRVEMLIWESDAIDERIAELEAQGITPIIVPDGDESHM